VNPALRFDVVAIGASAGAIEAVSTILSALPASYPLALIVVIHLPADRKSIVASLFQAKSQLRVKEVEDTEPIEGGTMYIAPPDYHVLVEQDRTLSLSAEEPVQFSRPSIDVLFESAADALGDRLLGVVLTGANSDGARGLRAISDSGGTALVQTPGSAYSPVMPQAAIDACPDARVLDLPGISEYLKRIGMGEQP